MPEEVVMTLQLTKSAHFNEKAIEYVTSHLSQMELAEVSAVFSAVMANTTGLDSSPQSQAKMLDFSKRILAYFTENIHRLDDKALA